MDKGFVIAIDGPVASGKGTIAPKLSEKINGTYLYTGGTYRAVALYCLQNNIVADNKSAVIGALSDIKIDLRGKNVFLNGIDVTEEIKTPDVAILSSKVSVFREVREEMVKVQQDAAEREIMEGKVVITEGRDTGTKVFPDAKVKIFLTADSVGRAKRRMKQYEDKGIKLEFEKVLKETLERDKRDFERETDPLSKEPEKLGYIVIDNSNQTEEQTVAIIISELKKLGIFL